VPSDVGTPVERGGDGRGKEPTHKLVSASRCKSGPGNCQEAR
jgi:hypothetical protein